MVAAHRSRHPLLVKTSAVLARALPGSFGSRTPAVIAIAVCFLGFVTLLRSGVGDAGTRRAIDDIGQTAAAAVASAAALWKQRGRSGRTRTSWLLIGAACGCWAVGQAIWTTYELRSWTTPFPSAADIGYLLFPALALPGLLVRPSDAFAGRGRIRLLLDGLIVAASLFSISWVTVLGKVFATPSESLLALIVGLAYPVSDLVMITVGVLVVVRARARSGLLLLISGLVGMAFADSAFSYLTAIGEYRTGSVVDFAWVGAFCLIGVSALREDSAETDEPTTSVSVGYVVLPYFLILTGIGVASRKIIEGNRVNLTVSAIAILALLVRQLLALLDNRQLTLRVERQREELRHQAFHDALTGLANRALFFDRLGHALELHRRDMRPVSVLYCDLDDFKIVNDTLGHDAGDSVLIAVAERLRATIRTGDTLARLGGDEFAIVVEDGGSAIELSARLLASLSVPVSFGGRDIPVKASIGVCEIAPSDAPMQVEDLIKRADMAMYTAKRSGKDTSVVWTPELAADNPDDLDLRLELAAAIRQGTLKVAFQPILLMSGEAYGFEALARWSRDTKPVTPDVFIPIAERAGLLPDLDMSVIQQAMACFREENPPGLLSVNVGLAHLADRTVVERLDAAMAHSGLPADRLLIEVPEDQTIDRPEIMAALRAIRRRGIKIALDDFGVGYSNLSRISTLSPDVIKLDRSFVTPLTESSRHVDFVAGIIDLSHRLGALVVAEGVETASQRAVLQQIGCDAVQGFLYGRPSGTLDVPDGFADLAPRGVG